MLVSLTLLLFCQLVGEVVVAATGLPVPGPVLGMLLLLVVFLVRGGPDQRTTDVANSLLSHLSLLFVPAGVGVMVHWQRIGSEWFAISVALLASTLVGLAVTALVMQLALRLTAAGSREETDD
jgi:putative effector of murein hydrolase LrgA (UPF0299 family)